MASDLERPSLFVDRFEGLAESVRFLSREPFMGTYTPPALRVGEHLVRFSAFLPGSEDLPYSPSLLHQTLEEKSQGSIKFLGIESERFIKPGQKRNGVDMYELSKVEKAFSQYQAGAYKLSAKRAKQLGFSEEFVKNQARYRRVSRALTQFLKTQAEQIGT